LKILFLGDIVGQPGRKTVRKLLPKIKAECGIDFVIANGENSAGGLGITPKIINTLTESGIDALTSGNHVWKRKEIFEVLDDTNLLTRPANYPAAAPGHGYNIYNVMGNAGGNSIAVVNIQGRVFLENIDCPFAAMDKILAELTGGAGKKNIIIVDLHAEATAEKIAMGWYLDGKVSALIGTHTHVQTSDAAVLAEGTAYITDAGMTGSKAGVIGVEKEVILKKFLTGLPFKFKVAKEQLYLEGVIIDIDNQSLKAKSIKTIRESYN
jgi:metallophosphoesterase (TIGR00282 family)